MTSLAFLQLFSSLRLTCKEVEKLGCCSAFREPREQNKAAPFPAVSPAPDLVLNLHSRYSHTSVYSKIDTFIWLQTDGTSRPDKWNLFLFDTFHVEESLQIFDMSLCWCSSVRLLQHEDMKLHLSQSHWCFSSAEMLKAQFLTQNRF
ncbi:uncharacterized [Tachysurus ichikawai]